MDDLISAVGLSPDVLMDPTAWVDADKMERFLTLAEADYRRQNHEESLIEKVGHTSRYLYAWGVLNGVLKMMERPEEVLFQPDRFLAHFISPHPSVSAFAKIEDGVRFQLDAEVYNFPAIQLYMKAMLEALPTFSGSPLSSCRWERTTVEIKYQGVQADLSPEMDEGRQMNPQLIQELIHSVEQGQRELQNKSKKIMELEMQLASQKSQIHRLQKKETSQPSLVAIDEDFLREEIKGLQFQISRMSDYFARAHQLIILLVAQDRKSPQVQEAMRRVDWEFVVKEVPTLVKAAGERVKNLSQLAKPKKVQAMTLNESLEQENPLPH
ncbi:MAG: hypothetical protein K2X47_06600 [Bdellovibrionales bacterium]|nr:hypothetical protein [Bdellovibrionales bacterium]